MNLLKYFDLNRRVRATNSLSSRRNGVPQKHGRGHWLEREAEVNHPSHGILFACWLALTRQDEDNLSIADQLLMYCGVLMGVYFSGVIRGQDFRPTLLLAALVSLIIIPIVFEKLNINPNAPLIVRFGLFVQNGVFWDVLLQAISTIRN